MSRADFVGEQRFRFLYQLFVLSGKADIKEIPVTQINEGLGFTGEQVEEIKHFLKAEELIKSTQDDRSVLITEKGMYAIEDALSTPHRATYYFPPIKTIPLRIGIDIQELYRDSKRFAVLNPLVYRHVGDFLSFLRENFWQVNLDSNQKSILQDALRSIEQEHLSAKPKWEIVLGGLEEIRHILEGGSKTGVEQELLAKLLMILS